LEEFDSIETGVVDLFNENEVEEVIGDKFFGTQVFQVSGFKEHVGGNTFCAAEL
jgi:hypothetical protein